MLRSNHQPDLLLSPITKPPPVPQPCPSVPQPWRKWLWFCLSTNSGTTTLLNDICNQTNNELFCAPHPSWALRRKPKTPSPSVKPVCIKAARAEHGATTPYLSENTPRASEEGRRHISSSCIIQKPSWWCSRAAARRGPAWKKAQWAPGRGRLTFPHTTPSRPHTHTDTHKTTRHHFPNCPGLPWKCEIYL